MLAELVSLECPLCALVSNWGIDLFSPEGGAKLLQS